MTVAMPYAPVEYRLSRRTVLYAAVYPTLLALLLSVLAGVVVVFTTGQIMHSQMANDLAQQRYEQQVQSWRTHVAAGLAPIQATVLSDAVLASGDHLVGLQLVDGSTVNVQASAACLPANSDALMPASTLSVLHTASASAVPVLFSSAGNCLSAANVSTDPAQPYAAPAPPITVPILGYLIDCVCAVGGLILVGIGLRRRLEMARYGLSMPMNRRRRRQRRQLVSRVGALVLIASVACYPVLAHVSVWVSEVITHLK